MIQKIFYILESIERKLPISTFLYALGYSKDKIINTFYSTSKYTYEKESKNWIVDFDLDNYKRPLKLSFDLIDAKNNKKILGKGEKLNQVIAKRLKEKGLAAIAVPSEQIVGKYIGKDIKDKNGELIVRAGFDITEEQLEKVISQEEKEINIVNIDPINKGPYILESLKIDKNLNKIDALNDIYKVLRPGEAPSSEIAEEIFKNLYFKKERYDLSEVGRVKLNSKLNLNTNAKKTTLESEDIIAIIKFMLDLRDGRGDVDDIDHLGNRRVRSVGELVENQFRIGLLRMERTVKEKMSTFLEIESAMPQDLINAKPISNFIKRFFSTSQLSQFMDQTNPLSEITHKRRVSALGPGGLTRERAGFEVRMFILLTMEEFVQLKLQRARILA